MAFPTTSVIDTFNRANGDVDAGAAYQKNPIMGLGATPSAVASNQAKVSGVGGYDQQAYTGASYAADQEVGIDLVTAPTTSADELYLLARIVTPSGVAMTGGGYVVTWAKQASDYTLKFERMLNGNLDALVSTQTGLANLADGDALAVEARGTAIQAKRRSGGVWSNYGTPITDSTYNTGTSKYVGFGLYEDSTQVIRLDNLFGGSIVTPGDDNAAALLFSRRRRRAVV